MGGSPGLVPDFKPEPGTKLALEGWPFFAEVVTEVGADGFAGAASDFAPFFVDGAAGLLGVSVVLFDAIGS